jgi:hypothetical protein
MGKKPECRGCGRTLLGSPYHTGKPAYTPENPMLPVPANHYGGHVCSRQCDERAVLELESSMPGAGKAKRLNPSIARKLHGNWDRYERLAR